ncbi:MAG: histidine triad nucleotide-binding protein [bacterium]
MGTDCLFCKFVRKEIEPKVVFEDDLVLAFRDIQPQAPVHVLLIPKNHIDSVSAVPVGSDIVAVLTDRAVQVAAQLGIARDGFRLVLNEGLNGGQSVPHLHLHLLGGRPMNWPPG